MKPVLVEISARHVHVSREDLDILFGKGYELTPKKDLSQPGQFACEERVSIVGPKNTIKNVIVLGPERKASQVEVSRTDARNRGITAPVRESGDVANSGACKLVGPCGEVELSEGVIVAKRHIHFTPDEAAAANVSDKEIVQVKVVSERTTIFDDVVVRVHPNFSGAMHIDTDESNAACAFGQIYGEIIKK